MYSGLLCPLCKKHTLSATFHSHTIPYFGEVMESVIKCSSCKYRHAEVFALEQKEPVRYTLDVEGEEDISVRVIRSSYATIEIPDLGVKVTPGTEANGYISNVEGVLSRVEEVLITANSWNKGKKAEQAKKLLDKIGRIKKGEEGMRLIIEDPTGNSAIISKKAVKERVKQ